MVNHVLILFMHSLKKRKIIIMKNYVYAYRQKTTFVAHQIFGGWKQTDEDQERIGKKMKPLARNHFRERRNREKMPARPFWFALSLSRSLAGDRERNQWWHCGYKYMTILYSLSFSLYISIYLPSRFLRPANTDTSLSFSLYLY